MWDFVIVNNWSFFLLKLSLLNNFTSCCRSFCCSLINCLNSQNALFLFCRGLWLRLVSEWKIVPRLTNFDFYYGCFIMCPCWGLDSHVLLLEQEPRWVSVHSEWTQCACVTTREGACFPCVTSGAGSLSVLHIPQFRSCDRSLARVTRNMHRLSFLPFPRFRYLMRYGTVTANESFLLYSLLFSVSTL